MRGTFKAVAALSVLALLTAACAQQPATGTGGRRRRARPSRPAPAPSRPAWSPTPAVSTTSRSTSPRGRACRRRRSADSSIQIKNLPSTSTADYAKNITTFIAQKCGIIVTVGFLMADATEAAAKANPSQKFAIVDCSYASAACQADAERTSTSWSSTPCRTASSAVTWPPGMSKTGKVATYGGEQFGTVTIYEDGFWDGVQYYNQQHHKNVTGARLEREDPEGHLRRQLHRPRRRPADRQHVHQRGRRHHLPGRRRRRASARPRPSRPPTTAARTST